jgi:glycine cleavage system aminomethyltransferase T
MTSGLRAWDSLVTKDYLRAELAEVRTEMALLRAGFERALRSQTRWFVGALLVSQGVVVAAIAAITGA